MEADEREGGEAVCFEHFGFVVCLGRNTRSFLSSTFLLFSLSLHLRDAGTTHYSHQRHSLLVDHTNRQLISTLDDLSSLLGRDVVGNLSAVRRVVHHQKLQVLHVAHDELVQSVGQHVLGGGVGTVTNVGHQSGTTEATSAAAINTLRLSPVLLIA